MKMQSLHRVTAWAWLLVLLLQYWSSFLVDASHVIYPEDQSVPAAAVNPKLRTSYHFRPPKNWINDPNGPMYYKGFYHLFYQYNPYGSVWGNIIWAHSISTDLINWIALDPAIYPTIPSDIGGCWSGSATLLPNGTPVIMYTGIDLYNNQVQNVAYPKNLSDPYLREWIKPDYNPVISPVNGINASAFRDPTTAWYGSDRHWRLVVGSKINNLGMAVLYRSRDFKTWVKAKHPLHSGKTGMWECPDFYPVSTVGTNGLDSWENGLDTKFVLKISLDLTRFEYYTVGSYNHSQDRYIPDGVSPDNNTGLRYDYGDFYASKTFFDQHKGRRILWGWANESDTPNDDIAKGWAGIQAIPRKIWLDPSGKQLVQWPIEEIGTLRGKHVTIDDKVVKSGDYFEVTGVESVQADVEVTFNISSLDKAEQFDPAYRGDAQTLCGIKTADVKGGVGPFGLWVLASGDLKERTAVFFRIFKDNDKHVVLMCNDPTHSSYMHNMYKPTFAGFVDVDIASTGSISVRTLIDHSVVESFGAHGKTCILSRVYPTLALGNNAHLYVFNHGEEDIKVTKLMAWEMKKPFMNGVH